MYRASLTICLLPTLSVWMAGPAAAQDVRTLVHQTPDGVIATHEHQPSAAEATWTAGWPSGPACGPRDSGVIWHNTLSDAIYNNTGISLPAERLCTGTWLNPPKEFELIPLEGDGTPDWVYPGTDFEVAASRDADVLAAIDYDSSTLTATIYRWQPGSSTPLWSYAISPCSRSSHRSLAVSPDGSTIAVLLTMQANPNFTRLYYFDADSATPLGTYEPADASFGRNVDISAHGEYIALYAGVRVCVFDTVAEVERVNLNAGATAEGVAISGDGEYLAYGWSSLFFRQWTGSTYALLWSRPGSGYYLSRCALSTDGSTLAAAWYRSDFKQNKIELFDVPSSTPRWTYLFNVGVGAYQEYPAKVALTADGSYCAVASWGDIANSNPEVHVFGREDSTPLLTVDTPGSMFDVDIAAMPGGPVYISACGKHIHANESGRGGDLYSIRLERYGLGDLNCDGTVDGFDIQPFVLALTDPDQYANQYPDCDYLLADINQDGSVDGFDIQPFVDLLTG